eukprot:UN00525
MEETEYNASKYIQPDNAIRVESKPCPRCKTQWNKNGGCKHMHCRICCFHWCWDRGLSFSIGRNHLTYYECANDAKKATVIVTGSSDAKLTGELKRRELAKAT